MEIEDSNKQRLLTQQIISKSLSVRELENLIQSYRPKAQGPRVQTQAQDPVLSALQEQLQHALATKVRIMRKKKRGYIQIEFYSSEDLERIAQKIQGA